MSVPVKIYLTLKGPDGFDTKVFRDIETLRVQWDDLISNQDWEFAVIHVGYDCPTYNADEIRQYKSSLLISKPLFLTESARWALPQKFAVCSPFANGECRFENRHLEMCPIYLSLKEWGYEHEQDIQILGAAKGKHYARYRREDAQDWVKDLLQSSPDLGLTLLGFGICNEYEFRSYWERLNQDVLFHVGNFRFEYYRTKVDVNDPFALLPILPHWLLNCSIDRLDISVRAANVFSGEGILTVSDLLKYDSSRLLRIQNFGRKSLYAVAESLLQAYELHKKGSTSLFSEAGSNWVNEQDKSFRLRESILKSIDEFEDKQRNILLARFGLSGNPPMSVRQIGSLFSLSGSRISQIEQKYLTKIIGRQQWANMLTSKVYKLLENRSTPLFLSMLPVEDQWFGGFDNELESLAEIISKMSGEKLNVIKFKSNYILCKLNQYSFDNLIRNIRDWIEDIEIGTPKSEIQAELTTRLIGFGVPDLMNVIWDDIADRTHYAVKENAEILVGIGKSVDALINVILEEAQNPLHYSEIHSRAQNRTDRKIDIRRVHIALGDNPAAKLFDRGVYGLIRHLKIDQKQKDRIISYIEEMLSEEERQWHTSEILKRIFEDDFDVPNNLTTYTLSIILESSKNVTSLGKNIWISSYTKGVFENRIMATDAFIAVLEKAGGPLEWNELKERACEFRGIPPSLQIKPTELIVKMSPHLWGLRYRDVSITPEDKKQALHILIEYMEETGHGIHVSEIDSIFLERKFSSAAGINPYVFLSFCSCDKRFRLSYGQLIGLSSWEDARRMNFAEAFRSMAKSFDRPFTLEEAHQKLESLLGRSIEKGRVSGALAMSNAVYDKDRSLWNLAATESKENDNEEVNLYASSA